MRALDEYPVGSPGAKVLRTTGARLWKGEPEPIYKIPRNRRFRLIVDGRGLKRPDNESLSLLGPGYDAALEDMRMTPGERAHVRLTPKGNRLVYRRWRRRSSGRSGTSRPRPGR